MVRILGERTVQLTRGAKPLIKQNSGQIVNFKHVKKNCSGCVLKLYLSISLKVVSYGKMSIMQDDIS